MSAHLDQFTYGWLTPTLAYALSFLGSLLGLVCTARARATPDSGRRGRWLVLAAWAIGGTGIWVMHFMAMIGFTVPGFPVRYDIPITIASWITAIVVVGIGLFIVGYGKPNAFKIIVAGILGGFGVAAMHYTGMAAMRVPGVVTYDTPLVIASVVIAVVAVTVALWFTVTLRRGTALTIAAAIMGVAVCGMHYTGMAALRVTVGEIARPIEGLTPTNFLVPIVIFVVVVTLTLFYALLSRADTNDEQPGAGAVGPPLYPGPRPNMGSAFRTRPARG